MTIKEKVLATFAGKANQVFQSYEIVDSVLQLFPDTNRVSVMPADYCYNRTNKGIKFDFHLFESLDNGMYKCLGWKIPYDGIVKWKGNEVGKWNKGNAPEINYKKSDRK